MKRLILISALITVALTTTMAQGPSTALTPETKTQTIQELFKAMREDYAFPEVAKKAESAIQGHLAAHDYDAITDGKQFAIALNKDLKDVCHDAHLHVSYSETALPVRQERRQPTPAEIEQDREITKYINAGFTKVERMDGNIGYIAFRNFKEVEAARRPVKAAMEFLRDTDALIIDIRQNGGGEPETVQLICSYLFDDKPVHLNDLVSREGKHQEFWTLKKVDGPRYLGKDVYILTSKRTGSAAEEFAYDLQNQKRATIIGEPTWGGANPGGFSRLNDHFTAFIPVAHAENPITKTNWEGTGVQPDIAVDPKDGLATAYQMALRKEISSTSDADRKTMLEQILKDQMDKKGQ